jgi:hypothetical protein
LSTYASSNRQKIPALVSGALSLSETVQEFKQERRLLQGKNIISIQTEDFYLFILLFNADLIQPQNYTLSHNHAESSIKKINSPPSIPAFTL